MCGYFPSGLSWWKRRLRTITDKLLRDECAVLYTSFFSSSSAITAKVMTWQEATPSLGGHAGQVAQKHPTHRRLMEGVVQRD